MCSYNFEKFFDYAEIENEVDLELQEKLLERINWLINEGIIRIEAKHELPNCESKTSIYGT